MCNNRRLFRDQRNPDKLISIETLIREYGELIASGSIDPLKITFQQHLQNCMESEGGTLSEYNPVVKPMATYQFMIRETLTLIVEVEAASFEEAQEEVERNYHNGEYDLDHNCFAGAEFRPCCSCCESDFEDDYELREVDDGTTEARVLCGRCVADLENSGELTRCEFCGNVFSPTRLKVNPVNGTQEICPLCGKVWCE